MDTICITCLEEYERLHGKSGSEREDLEKDPKLAKPCDLHKLRIVKN